MPEMNPVFAAGYEYAGTLSLDKLPLHLLIDTLDTYKEVALLNQSAYYLGMARWMEEEIMRREVPAA